jgi:hypothetical protein
MQTDELIQTLTSDCAAVRRLAHPGWRAAFWFAISAGYVVAVVAVIGLRPDIPSKLGDLKFLVEVGAAFLTSMMAAAAAFCAGCPGRPIWERFAPVPFLALWLGTLGTGCWHDWLALGVAGLAVRPEPMCFPVIFAIGFIPSILIFAMIRRGAPIAPMSAMGLAALAAAALAATALRLVHSVDSSLMVLVWQFGSVVVLTLLEAPCGRFFLRWPTLQEVLAADRRMPR